MNDIHCSVPSESIWTERVWEHPFDPTISSAVKLVALYIAHRIGDGTSATIRIAEFQQATGYGKRHCQSATSWLVDHGFINITLHGGAKGANVYSFNAERFTSAPRPASGHVVAYIRLLKDSP